MTAPRIIAAALAVLYLINLRVTVWPLPTVPALAVVLVIGYAAAGYAAWRLARRIPWRPAW